MCINKVNILYNRCLWGNIKCCNRIKALNLVSLTGNRTPIVQRNSRSLHGKLAKKWTYNGRDTLYYDDDDDDDDDDGDDDDNDDDDYDFDDDDDDDDNRDDDKNDSEWLGLFDIQGVPGGMCQTSGECSLC